MPKVDSAWFKSALRNNKLTQRELSKQMGLDPSAVSLMLRGQRRIQIHEATRMAEILGTSAKDVMNAAGIHVRSAVGDTEVEIVGAVDETGTVKFAGKPLDSVHVPSGRDFSGEAVRWQTGLTNAEMLDGWVGVLGHASNNPMDHIGKLCVCELPGKRHVVRWVRMGYTPGRYVLVAVRPEMQETEVISVRPVVLVVPRA